MVAHADKLKKCYGETPRSWLLEEPEPSQPTYVPEAPADESSEGSDAEEAEQHPPADSEPALDEPAELSPEVSQQSDVLDVQPPVDVGVGTRNAPGTDESVLRDRRRMRRPARFIN